MRPKFVEGLRPRCGLRGVKRGTVLRREDLLRDEFIIDVGVDRLHVHADASSFGYSDYANILRMREIERDPAHVLIGQLWLSVLEVFEGERLWKHIQVTS